MHRADNNPGGAAHVIRVRKRISREGGRKDQEVNKDKFEAGAELDAETSWCRSSSEEKLVPSCLVTLALAQSRR